jgi:tetratricopeptide (TPR) repeat protein
MPADDSTPRPLRGSNQPQGGITHRWFGDLDQSEFELELFEQVLERAPEDWTVLRLVGELLARKGRFDRALEIDRRLAALRPEDCIAHYNLACSLAMQGERHQALEHLTRSLALGYRDFAHLDLDPDLDSLRDEPAYTALMHRFRANAD